MLPLKYEVKKITDTVEKITDICNSLKFPTFQVSHLRRQTNILVWHNQLSISSLFHQV